MQLTEEQINQLAPDAASAKVGKSQASSTKWSGHGLTAGVALWGYCQGSGKNPYQTQIDLNSLAYKCSCPSRKFPCKHALGLMYYFASAPHSFPVETPPAWVAEWLGKRQTRKESSVESPSKPVDAVQQAKRLASREEKVIQGVQDLQLWIRDTLRNGLHIVQENHATYFAHQAARLVDAQAPGLAARVRLMGELNFFREDWNRELLSCLSSLYLLTEAYCHQDTLPEALRQEVRNLIGFSQDQRELATQAGIFDRWAVLSKESSESQSVCMDSYWLYALEQKQYVRYQVFYHRSQPPAQILTPGTILHAEVVLFAGLPPHRAFLKPPVRTEILAESTHAHTNWTEVMAEHREIRIANPWADHLPAILSGVHLCQVGDQWMLKDAADHLAAIPPQTGFVWQLLALGGGRELTIFLEMNNQQECNPMGAWHGGKYISR